MDRYDITVRNTCLKKVRVNNNQNLRKLRRKIKEFQMKIQLKNKVGIK